MSPLILYLITFIAGIFSGVQLEYLGDGVLWACISLLTCSIICSLFIRHKSIAIDYRRFRITALAITFAFSFCYGNMRATDTDYTDEESRGIQDARTYISATLAQEGIETRNLALVNAILLGDRSQLDKQQVSAFRNTGTMHILVVSGMHVALIYIAIKTAFALIGLRRNNWVTLLSIALIWMYALLTGAAPSVCRATLMITIMTLVPIINARMDRRDGIYIALFALLLYDPNLVHSYSLWLSFMAVFALFQSSHAIAQLEKKIPTRIGKHIVQICLASCVCQAATAPIILTFNDQFPTFFAINNLAIVPILTPLLITTCGIIILPHSIAQYLAIAANTLIRWMDEYTQYAQTWHHATIHLAGYTQIETIMMTCCVALVFAIIGTWGTRHKNICGGALCITISALTGLTIYLDTKSEQMEDRVIIWRRYDKTNISLYTNSTLTHYLEDDREEYTLRECEKLKQEFRAYKNNILRRDKGLLITTGTDSIYIGRDGIANRKDEIIDIQLMNERRIDIAIGSGSAMRDTRECKDRVSKDI